MAKKSHKNKLTLCRFEANFPLASAAAFGFPLLPAIPETTPYKKHKNK
jgi:hypothetical protein